MSKTIPLSQLQRFAERMPGAHLKVAVDIHFVQLDAEDWSATIDEDGTLMTYGYPDGRALYDSLRVLFEECGEPTHHTEDPSPYGSVSKLTGKPIDPATHRCKCGETYSLSSLDGKVWRCPVCC